MHISIAGFFGNSPRRGLSFARDFAQALEELNFRTLSLPEHVVFFPTYESDYPYTDDGEPNWGPDTGIFDPLFVAQALALTTTKLRFITGVLILTQRPALLTAKEVLTLDHFTDGRFELGVGSGWSWEEYSALGVDFARRGRRLDEYIEALRVAWTDDRATYTGEFVHFENAVMNPKPITPGGPPIIIGGDSPAAMKRAAVLGDGWYGWWAQPDIKAHLGQLGETLNAHGRDLSDEDFDFKLGLPLSEINPSEIEAKVELAASLGVDELILAPPIPTKDFRTHLQLVARAAGLV